MEEKCRAGRPRHPLFKHNGKLNSAARVSLRGRAKLNYEYISLHEDAGKMNVPTFSIGNVIQKAGMMEN